MKKIFLVLLMLILTTSLAYAGSAEKAGLAGALKALGDQRKQRQLLRQRQQQQQYQKEVMIFQTLMQTGNYDIAKENEPADINLSLLGIRLKKSDK